MYPNGYSNLFRSSISFLKNINYQSLLEGTSKTLGVINQAIPVYYQVKPIFNNVGTIFKISNALKESPHQETIKEKNNTSSIFYV